MTYSSLRHESWSNTIKGKRKGNKVKFTYKAVGEDEKGSGRMSVLRYGGREAQATDNRSRLVVRKEMIHMLRARR